MNSKINASTVGFAIGEAFGLPLNYERKEKLINKPVTKMINGITHKTQNARSIIKETNLPV